MTAKHGKFLIEADGEFVLKKRHMNTLQRGFGPGRFEFEQANEMSLKMVAHD